MIPSQAFALNEYLDGADASKTSDKEDTPAALSNRPEETMTVPVGYSDKLRVKRTPREAVPEVFQ